MKLGIIGFGRRMQSLLRMVELFNTPARVHAVADPDFQSVRDRLTKAGKPVPDAKVYDDADDMLAGEDLDAVMIGTRCGLHAAMAMKVIEKGLPLYLEKPIATSRADLEALAAAARKRKTKAVVSFPLKVSPLIAKVKEIVDAGKVGRVETIDAWNDPPYGATYFQNWYRDENETGGLWLQKATHDFDYLNSLVGSAPIRVAAVQSNRVFKGERPAGLKCRDCKEWETCLESPFHLYYSRGATEGVVDNDFSCMFAEDTGNEDYGHALVEYENGATVSYTQTFMVRGRYGRRGGRLYGYLGTVEFDWFTDEVKVFMNHSPGSETHHVGSKALSHAGGDNILIWNFLKMAEGEAESVSPIEEAITSVNMCLAARESVARKAFVDIEAV